MKTHFKPLFQILGIAFLIVLSANLAYSQTVNLYLVKENIETVVGNSELIISDPLTISSYNSLPEYQDYKNKSEGEPVEVPNNVDVTMGTDLTPTSKFLTLPLGYSWKNFSVSGSIPYYFSRSINYSHGTEKASGIGDLALKIAYRKQQEKLRTEYNLSIKLPTGNEAKQVNGYLVPLGTGSTDIMGQGILTYSNKKNLVYANLAFRLNGTAERVAQITYPDTEGTETINYHVKNGNTLMLNTSYSYKIWKYAALVAGVSAAANGKGEIYRDHSYSNGQADTTYNGMSANQDFIFVDMNPSVVFTVYKVNLSIGCQIPAYTKQDANSSEGDRKVAYYIRFICPIY